MRYVISSITALLILAGAFVIFFAPEPASAPTRGTTEKEKPTAVVTYVCNNKKVIDASFYEHETSEPSAPGEPPTPNGTVDIVLSDSRSFTLKQTISADGVRYSDGNPSTEDSEQFIFWSKGNGALVTDHGDETSFKNCIATAPISEKLPNIYHDGQYGFTIRYGKEWNVNTAYMYQLRGEGEATPVGVKFLIPESFTSGTNLSKTDTGVSVELLQFDTPDVTCSASLFTSQPADIKTITINDAEYSFATTSDAGAGNVYEEYVYALPYSQPCTAVRYFIHATNIGNYDPGTIREFDKQSLLKTFDEIRDTLVKQ